MIRVTRTAEPAALRRNRARWQAALDSATTPEARQKAQAKYRHADVQAALRAMFDGNCAYCESKFDHVAHGHIEHFWPKSVYPERTFDWKNLLWACPICNSDHKGDTFPLADDGTPLLIDPTAEEPSEHLAFVWDPETGLATVGATTERGRATCETVGLNREALRRQRSRRVAQMLALAKIPGGEELLREACREYTAFAKALVLTPAPSPHEGEPERGLGEGVRG